MKITLEFKKKKKNNILKLPNEGLTQQGHGLALSMHTDTNSPF